MTRIACPNRVKHSYISTRSFVDIARRVLLAVILRPFNCLFGCLVGTFSALNIMFHLSRVELSTTIEIPALAKLFEASKYSESSSTFEAFNDRYQVQYLLGTLVYRVGM